MNSKTIIHTFLATIWYAVPILISLLYADFFFGLPKFSFVFDFPLGLFFAVVGLFLIFKSTSDLIKYGRGSPHPYYPTKFLVKQGIYKHLRHPIYLGWLFATLGAALFFGSFLILESLLIIIAVLFFYVRAEEKNLEKKFGKSFVEYKKKVPAWIPKI